MSRLAREEGVAILVTTHYLTEAEHCDHLALMYAGRIVAEGSPSDMKNQVEHEAGRLLEIDTNVPGQACRRLKGAGFSGAALYGTKIHLLSRNPSEDEERLRGVLASDGVRVKMITERPLTLEDVFVRRVMALEQQERAAGRETGP